jgi:nicotinate-nucleotide adenylyltransferase
MTTILRNELPARWRRRVKVSAFELRRKRPSHTFQTLRYFRSRYPAAELWFLTGSDSFAAFPRWKRRSELRKACRWIVGRREGTPSLPRNLPPHEVLPGRFSRISSTDARCRLLADLTTQGVLSKKILAHIRTRALYGLKIHQELRRTLSPERYRHTLEVARLALKLALIHDFDPELAATAGLLHDSGRRYRPDQMRRYALKHRLRVPALNAVVRNASLLLHAFISADLAREHFGIQDPAILSAIRNHTLGAVGMAEMDRLLYVADIASEDRGFPEAPRIRALAMRNLNAAFALAVKTKIAYVGKNGMWLHPDRRKVEAWSQR